MSLSTSFPPNTKHHGSTTTTILTITKTKKTKKTTFPTPKKQQLGILTNSAKLSQLHPASHLNSLLPTLRLAENPPPSLPSQNADEARLANPRSIPYLQSHPFPPSLLRVPDLQPISSS